MFYLATCCVQEDDTYAFVVLCVGLTYILYQYCQARREPQRGPGKQSRGAPKHFHGAPLERIFFEVFFHNGTLWRTLYFWPTAGPPKRRGARGS